MTFFVHLNIIMKFSSNASLFETLTRVFNGNYQKPDQNLVDKGRKATSNLVNSLFEQSSSFNYRSVFFSQKFDINLNF